MEDLTQTSVYSEPSTGTGDRRSFRQLFRGLRDNGSLLLLLVRRDLRVRYRQSALGLIWVLLPPLVTMAIFAVLASYRVLPIGDVAVAYPAYALWNLSVWYLFSGVLLATTNSLSSAGPLVTKLNFSKDVLVVAAAGQPLVDFLVRLLPVSIAFIWYGIGPQASSWCIPLVLVCIVLMALGLGFVFAVLNLLLKDFGNLLTILLTIGVFLAPVLYAPAEVGPLVLLNRYNPFSPLLIATQDLLFSGMLTDPVFVLLAALLSVCVFLFGWKFFHLCLPRVVEQA